MDDSEAYEGDDAEPGHGMQEQAVAQPATRGRSRRHDRRCFGRLEQEDQRLKKHYGRWMNIVRSLEY